MDCESWTQHLTHDACGWNLSVPHTRLVLHKSTTEFQNRDHPIHFSEIYSNEKKLETSFLFRQTGFSEFRLILHRVGRKSYSSKWSWSCCFVSAYLVLKARQNGYIYLKGGRKSWTNGSGLFNLKPLRKKGLTLRQSKNTKTIYDELKLIGSQWYRDVYHWWVKWAGCPVYLN